MGFPLTLALRYLRSKKREFVSVGTVFATIGVALGVAALAIVMSVTGGFQEQFREKVLGVNAHVLVLKYSIDFREYRDVMKKCEKIPGVIGVAPFIINPMMVTHGDRTATGVLLKGVDPELMPKVLDLPKHILPGGSLVGLRREGAKPPERSRDAWKTQHNEATDADAGHHSFLQGLNDPLPAADLDAGVAAAGDAQAYVGSITPDGGYASRSSRTRTFSPTRSIPIRARAPIRSRSCPGSSSGAPWPSSSASTSATASR